MATDKIRETVEALQREARRRTATVDGPSANFYTGCEYAFREVLALLDSLGAQDGLTFDVERLARAIQEADADPFDHDRSMTDYAQRVANAYVRLGESS